MQENDAVPNVNALSTRASKCAEVQRCTLTVSYISMQDQNVAMCRKWHMLNDDKLLPEVDEEMMELLGMSGQCNFPLAS